MSFRGAATYTGKGVWHMTYQTDYLSFILLPSVPNTQVMAAMDIEMTSPIGPLVAVGNDQDHQFGVPVGTIVCMDDYTTQFPSLP